MLRTDVRPRSAARSISRAMRRFAFPAALALGVGCGAVPSSPRADVTDGNRDSSVQSSAGKTAGEPNDGFDSAVVAVFDEDGVARLQGTISTAGPADVDVFYLGSLAAGDHLIVDSSTPNKVGDKLDINLALFDDQERLVSVNDDRDDSALDGLIDVIIRHGGDPYYLVVSASHFAGGDRTTGTYAIDVERLAAGTVPPPAAQVLLLNFAGGLVDSPIIGRVELDPFDAADIAPRYEGQTGVMKKWIQSTVEQNYERFNVRVVSTDEGQPEGDFSTLSFGGYKNGILGLSEAVDEYNANFCDDAVIYVESFDPRDGLFFIPPTAVEMAIAIGNVAAHEGGHLLGLNHVDDGRDLMDTQSSADTLLTDQEFMQAPLNEQIAPLGMQDGVILLNETVGPSPGDELLRQLRPELPFLSAPRGPSKVYVRVQARDFLKSHRAASPAPPAEAGS